MGDKRSGLMTASITMKDGTVIQLQGPTAIVNSDRAIPIDDLPQAVINELLELGAIKRQNDQAQNFINKKFERWMKPY